MNKISKEAAPTARENLLKSAIQIRRGNEAVLAIVIDDDLEVLSKEKKLLVTKEAQFLFVLDIDLSRSFEDNRIQGLVRQLIHFIVDFSYFSFCGKRVIIIKATTDDLKEVAILRNEFSKLGLHDICFLTYANTVKTEDEVVKIEIIDANDSKTKRLFQSFQWFYKSSRSIEKTGSVYIEHADEESELPNLKLAYSDATDEIEILKKNLYDLNKYYRYVRGETTFKYSNREEEKTEQEITPATVPANDLVHLVNSTVNHPDDFSLLKKYQDQYERLPGTYKKIGTFLKIITGKTPYLRHFSKKQKNTYINFLGFLPEDKKIEVWYYYEYEVLPTWYKRLGSWYLKRKTK